MKSLIDSMSEIAASFDALGDSLSTMTASTVKLGKAMEAAMSGKPIKSDDQLMRERVQALRKRSLRLKARRAVDGFREFIRKR